MSSTRSVAWATAPSTAHAYGACPCSVSHGEKWSLLTSKSKPACSAPTAQRTRSLGPLCSVIRVYPKLVTLPTYPLGPSRLVQPLSTVVDTLWTSVRAAPTQEAADRLAGTVAQLGPVREGGEVVVELAEHVRRAPGHAEVGAEGPDRPPQAAHVEDRVAGDEQPRVLVEQRDVTRGVAGRVHDAQPARDGQH